MIFFQAQIKLVIILENFEVSCSISILLYKKKNIKKKKSFMQCAKIDTRASQFTDSTPYCACVGVGGGIVGWRSSGPSLTSCRDGGQVGSSFNQLDSARLLSFKGIKLRHYHQIQLLMQQVSRLVLGPNKLYFQKKSTRMLDGKPNKEILYFDGKFKIL